MSFHQSFLWLHPIQEKFTTFRVECCVLLLESSSVDFDRTMVHPFDRGPTKISFLSPCGFSTQRLARNIHSLDRVSRREVRADFVSLR